MRTDLVVLISITGLAVVSPAQSAAYDVPRCHGKAATIVGTEKADRIKGTGHADVIVGLGGDDEINGLAGRDVICGGDGSDSIRGGDGEDLLDGQLDNLRTFGDDTILHGDTLEGGAGDDRLFLGRDERGAKPIRIPEVVTYRRSAGPVTIVIGRRTAHAEGEGHDRIDLAAMTLFVASRHDDVVTGGPGSDFIAGGGGSDTVRLGGGDDAFVDPANLRQGQPAASGDDIVEGGPGRDSLWSTSGADVFRGGPDADELSAESFDAPSFYGGGGRDEIELPLAHASGAIGIGGPGPDRLELSRPDEIDSSRLPPSSDFPHVTVDMTLGTVTTEWKSGLATATVDAFHVVNTSDNLRLTYLGSNLSESVYAPAYRGASITLGAGDDLAVGGRRADVFDGGDGHDRVYGGPGDTCVAVEKALDCPAPIP